MADEFHLKYRPTTLKQVVGQDHILDSLRPLIKKGALPHSYLFVGPSGCGKTTLARILAGMVGCSLNGIIELDAATHNGIDEMRAVLDGSRYRSMGEAPNKMIIIDECHGLSKQAWQTLLKASEEPPPHLYWAFCTTEPHKVPDTVKTRCHTYEVKAVPGGTLFDLLNNVAEQEQLELDEDVIQLCVKEAGGSVRQGLVNLSSVRGATDRQHAFQMLTKSFEEAGGVALKLVKVLIGGAKWRDAVQLVKALPDEESAEGVRLMIVNYVGKVLLDTRDEKMAARLLTILDAFSRPFFDNEKRAPLLLAIGRIVYGE